MANSFGFRRILEGLRLVPKTSLTLDQAGDLQTKTSDGRLYYHDGASSSALVTQSSTDTLTNKTLTSPTINGGTITSASISPTSLIVKDNAFTIQDNADNTKQLQFQASNITTGTTRTLTSPDANTTLVGTDATQTLTNKNIDSDNNTITNIVDADIKAFAAIDRTKIAAGTPDYVVINSAFGILDEEQYLDPSRGGTGQGSTVDAFNALAPTTTKGDLVGYTTGNARVPIGSNGQVLTADSTQSLGLKWANPSTVANLAINIKTNTNYTLTNTDDVVLFSTGNTNRTGTLPSASSNPGKLFYIKKTDSGTGYVNVVPGGGDNIDGLSTLKMGTQYDEIALVSDGSTTWNILVFNVYVGACYYVSNSSSTTNVIGTNHNTPMDYDVRFYDPQGNVTTGSAWKFTCPMAGKYKISSLLIYQSLSWTAGNFTEMLLAVNAAVVRQGARENFYATGTRVVTFNSDWEISCFAGDYIQIYPFQNQVAGAGAALDTSSNTNCLINITRVGN